MKDCPKCKLVNPDTAERCDCGYDFPSGTMQSSYLTVKDRRRKVGAIGAVAVFLLMLRLGSLTTLAKHGWVPLAYAVGFIVLVIVAVLFWPRYSSRDDSDK
jgi:hypothetical protein